MVGLKEGLKPSFFLRRALLFKKYKKYISIHPMLLFKNTE
nr:MAG TPA: hypothetical protein [Caudoviricetes sp.]